MENQIIIHLIINNILVSTKPQLSLSKYKCMDYSPKLHYDLGFFITKNIYILTAYRLTGPKPTYCTFTS